MATSRGSQGLTIALVAALSVFACGKNSAPTPTGPTDGALGAEARVYLDALIALMQARSINRLTIDSC